jgi:methylmalonyl-CoA mutase
VGAVVDVAVAGATLGEIMRVLRAKEGGHPSVTPLRAERPARLFESLRAASDAHRAATGARPKVFLANMGPVKQHKARADFSRGFLEVGGFEVLNNKGFPNAEEAAKAALASGAKLMVICSTDETYLEIVPPFVKAVKQVRPEAQIILAGRPKDLVEPLRQAGVDEFIYLGADCAEMLRGFQEKLGMV